jgi:aspartate aminotransferase
VESSILILSHTPGISSRALDMPGSPIRRSFMAARALQERGVDVVRLDIGDPDFALPPHFAAAIEQALRDGHTHYSPMAGVPELRAALAAHVQRRYGVDCAAGEVIVNQGATEGLNAALTLTCDPGDFLLMPEIYWPNYIQQVALAGVRPAFYRLDRNFQPVLDDLPGLAAAAEEAGSRIAAVLMNSPSNPTGAVFPRATVEALYDFARDHGSWVVSDEAYCDYVFEGEHFSPLMLDRRQPVDERIVLAVFSASKSYAATGLRLGWTIAPTPAAAARLQIINEPLTGSLTTPLQYGLAAAVAVEDAHERRDALRGRWQLAHEMLAAAGLESAHPQGGLFYFVDISRTGLDAEQFADELLQQEHVAVVAGDGFGLQPHFENAREGFYPTDLARRHIRLCFAVPEARLRQGLEGLVAFLRRKTAGEGGR